jgi:uncharacterized protein (DUF1800 family)
MSSKLLFPSVAFGFLVLLAGCSSSQNTSRQTAFRHNPVPSIQMPWKEAGLTERQAAAHLLNRFTFGPRPGDIDQVVAIGLDDWMEQQLRGVPEDESLQHILDSLPSVMLTNSQIILKYPNRGMIRKELRADPRFAKDSLSIDSLGLETDRLKELIRRYMVEKGYRGEGELNDDLIAQKLFRAVYGSDQVLEVLTDFWMNHFNVSVTNGQARPFIQSFERDAIRPNVLGCFRELLSATAKHPAMLMYLNNAESVAEQGTETTLQFRTAVVRRPPLRLPENTPKPRVGLNENYARELMELHTLGVDGGYTQSDVTEVARALTGWTVYPLAAEDKRRERVNAMLADPRKYPGFVREGDFLFRADQHDARGKMILGHMFGPGGGIEDGERVLDLLAHSPSSARFIAKKLAVRFVSDTPSIALVDRLAKVFMDTGGDLQAVVVAIVESSEFWDAAKERGKVKSPFELAASSLRALNASIINPRGVIDWIRRMGQPLYGCMAPTGYPDRATAWVNTGSLLNRMNFGLKLAAGEIPGVRVNLFFLDRGRAPETLQDLLRFYASTLLPERDVEQTVRVLEPALRNLPNTINVRDVSTTANQIAADQSLTHQQLAQRSSLVASVTGIILGSPEFQRR